MAKGLYRADWAGLLPFCEFEPRDRADARRAAAAATQKMRQPLTKPMLTSLLVLLMSSCTGAGHLHRQNISLSTIKRMKAWMATGQWNAKLALPAGWKVKHGGSPCNYVLDPSHCCYRIDLQERLRSMAAWSEAAQLPQHKPILYLYSGIDLISAFGLFPNSSAYMLTSFLDAYPVAENSTDGNLFGYVHFCLGDSICAQQMMDDATHWFHHTMCMSFRSSMSVIMESVFSRHGTLPALLLQLKLAGMELISGEVTYHALQDSALCRSPGSNCKDQRDTHEVIKGISLEVQRRESQQQQRVKQRVAYTSGFFSRSTASALLHDLLRDQATDKPSSDSVILVSKAIHYEGEGRWNQSHARHEHASWLAHALARESTAIDVVVQDRSGAGCELMGHGVGGGHGGGSSGGGDFSVRAYGNCTRTAPQTDLVPDELPDACAAAASAAPQGGLHFGWGHPNQHYTTHEGCLFVYERGYRQVSL